MSLSVLLLSHIRRVLEEHEVDRASSAQLIRWLVELAEGPWARWWASSVDRADKGEDHAMDKAAASLASLLKPFRRDDGKPIRARTVRLADGSTPRGYTLEDFADAFPRYLGATSATGATPLASPVALVAPVAPTYQEEGAVSPNGQQGPCPECGARSVDPGYHGHAEGCSRFYAKGQEWDPQEYEPEGER